MSTEQILEYILRLGNIHLEGDYIEYLKKYCYFELKWFKLNELDKISHHDSHKINYDYRKIIEFKKLEIENIPPIVVVVDKKYILDGYHRYILYKEYNKSYILSYVNKPLLLIDQKQKINFNYG